MHHYFNTEIALKYGVNEAILLQNLSFWQLKNEVNEKNIYEGRCWTFNSVKAFCALFPYWSKGQIERILNNLEEKNLITSGNFNSAKFDRTKWYSVNREIHFLISGNGFTETEKPIPNINTDNKPDNNKNKQKEFFLKSFDEFRKLYPGKKRGLNTEFENFTKKHKDWKAVLPDLKSLLQCQINQRLVQEQAKQFVPLWKNLQTWINQRCWEEEENAPVQKPVLDDKYEGYKFS